MFLDRRPNHLGVMSSAIEALYAAGHALLAQQRFADASCIYRAMLACAPSDERGWLALGTCHEKIRQYDIALQLYGVGHAMAGAGVRCQLARARLFRKLGKRDEAEESLARARLRAQESADQELVNLVANEERPS
jgi:tetratricopeptide (TPR) repeat protein